MSRKEHLDELLSVARDFKDHLWRDHHERDMQPAIGLLVHNGMMRVPPNIINTISLQVDNVHDLLDVFFQYVADGDAPVALDDVRGAVLIADGYSVVGNPDEPIFEDGTSLIESFKNDPNSPVTESITVYMAERDVVGDCTMCLARLGYRLEDAGTLLWDDKPFYILPDDEPHSDGWEMTGDVYRVFRKYLRTEGLA